VGDEAASWNQGCPLPEWFSTRSTMTRMPRFFASWQSFSKSAFVP
jgi:hypothetical protein